MADPLYEKYERQYLQQAELCEENAVTEVRAAFAEFYHSYLQILRNEAGNRQTLFQMSGTRNVNLLTRCAQEIEAARDLAQRQLATALATAFGTITNLLPTSLPFSDNEPTLSGTSNHAANTEQEAGNLDNDSMSIKSEDSSECECECGCESVHSVEIKEEIENQTEMGTMAGTSINDSNIDDVSVNRETESASSDLVSNHEVEFTGLPIDETMRHSECAQVNMEDGQTRDLSGIINFVAISLPRPLVAYELSDEEDDNERANAVDTFDDHLPSMNGSAHSMIASTSTGRCRQPRNQVNVNYADPREELSVDTENLAMTGIRKSKQKRKMSSKSSSATTKKVRQPTSEEQSTAVSIVSEEPLKVITKRLCCPQVGCPKVCKNKKRLNVHLKTKHAIEPYRCLFSKCKHSFKYKSLLSDHLRNGHGSAPIGLVVCAPIPM